MIIQLTIKDAHDKPYHMAPFENYDAARDWLRARCYPLAGESVRLQQVETREDYDNNRYAAGIMTPKER